MSKKLQQALGDWRTSATNVKARIYAETIEGKKAKKQAPLYMKVGAAAAVLAAGITGTVLISKDPTPSTTPAIENTETINEQNEDFRPISETFLMVEQYENFYRGTSVLYTAETAISYALSTAIDYYALFNHLAEHGITWEEKQRDIFRRSAESALDYDLKDSDFAAYFNKMLKELSITKEQYVEEYLLVNQEYEILRRKMMNEGIGLEDGYYEVSKIEDAFRQKMGITFDYVQYLAFSDQEHLTPLDPQPKLSFNDAISYPQEVSKNADGEYIFIDAEPHIPTFLMEPDENGYEGDYLYTLMYKNKIDGFSRLTYPKIKKLVEEEAAKGDELANKVLDYFDILERSVEWEFEPHRYEFNNTPTFNEENLRVHNDLTLKIVEYEYYQKNENIFDKSAAYRYANELVAEMYGLFNYLAQDHNYSLSAEERAILKGSARQEVEALMENELEKAYMDTLLQTLNITLDDYIQYYLLPKKEFEELKKRMTKERIGIDKNGRYNMGKQASRYRQKIDFTWRKLFDTMEEKQNAEPPVTVLEEQPDLPFAINPKMPITVLLNKDGEYVLEYPSVLELCLTEEQLDAFKNIQQTYDLPPLARYSAKAYIQYAQLQSTTAANELVEILTLFDRTVN